MKLQQIVRELEDAVRRMGVQVRCEQGHFRGGYCKVGEEEVVVLNKRHPPEVHLAVLADALRELPVETVFLKPAVRAALEAAWTQRETVARPVPDAMEEEDG
ncbi:hypothetical protein GQ464_006725 [Rhodocaloribacter litoris]|uniref:hypothetical protein n=1 Tax=Rhodocaloribacter litoris TaxID=2558931 RepID=UPI001421F2B6|nr:hypothetical protein [Rhodocaloribacter litoris]QXD16629.1 hypothetical protein GQ464_006725 [Rhodocaloribacter litoris]GIV59374.1 MAG: hypothetical protein KatS3mg043_0463 [Rhodothermaceae bacterium]